VNDKFLLKSTHLRAVLAEYGLGWKPLIVAELSAPCFSPESCGEGFTERQSDYAARIYAELIAADIQMGVWFSLQMPDDDPMKHDLLDGPESIRRPAYYALRNSLALLRDAQPGSPPAIQPDSVSIQIVQLRTPRGSIYVVWNPSQLGSTAFLLIPTGAHLICTDHLELPTPQTYDCTNQVSDGVLLVQTNSTRYVEVIEP
jgi:hypothetical protein